MNASTDLIPGMDMLIEHMRRQAECITDLKGIVEELKHQNKMLKQEHLEEIQTYKETLEEHFHHYDNLKAENQKLQKYADIMGDIDGDQLSDLLKDYGWEYDENGELIKVVDEDTDSDEEDELEYMVFELVGYFKDNEGNIFTDVEEGEEIGPDIVGHFDDIAGKIIWKSDAFRDHHVLTSKQTLMKIKGLTIAKTI